MKVLKDMNFTVLNSANNHAMDYGVQGMKDTLGEFAKQNLDIVGAGYSLSDAKKKISYQKVNGVTIATLGFTDVSGKGFAAKKNTPGVLPADPEIFIPMISEAKNMRTLLLCSHTGDKSMTMIQMTASASLQEPCLMRELTSSSAITRTS